MRAESPATRQASRAGESPGPAALRWISLVLIFAPLIVRATTQSTNLPDWDIDPTVLPLATPAIGPAGSMLIDAIILIGVALGLLGERERRWTRRESVLVLLAGVGAVAAIAHGWVLPTPDAPPGVRGGLTDQRIGATWLSAIAAAVALHRMCARAEVRRVVLGLLLAFVLMITLRGLHQTVVEHPQLMRSFEANKERERIARGWSEDSPLWKSYLRRLSQADATAWFGLSNVFASFCATGLALGAALLALPRARRTSNREPAPPRHAMLVVLLASLLSAAGIWAADSKGGYLLAIGGLFLVGIGLTCRTHPRWQARLPVSWIGPGAVAAALAAVVARGLIGERLDELSLLFRWFYQQATLRIFAEHPLWGVGPGGFQTAYLAAKNPLSPEEIVSPHSIFFDYLGTLGIWGIAWIALILCLLSGIGRGLLAPSDDAPLSQPRNALRVGMLTLAIATLVATWFETALTTPEAAFVRVAGLGLGCALIWALVRGQWGVGADRLALAAGGLTLALHAQIEVTASYPISAGLVLAAIAAAGATVPDSQPLATCSRRSPFVAAAACVAVSSLLLWTAGARSWPWQRQLRLAAEPARILGAFSERFAALAANRFQPIPDSAYGPDSGDRWLQDVSSHLGRSVTIASSPDPASLMRELESRLLPIAAAHLQSAADIYPEEWRVARECSRMHLRVAVGNQRVDAALAAKQGQLAAAALWPKGLTEGSASPGRLRALAVVHETLAREAAQRSSLSEAARLLELATVNDPYNLDIAWRLFTIHRQMLSPSTPPDGLTRRWAAKAIELDDLSRLDRQVRSLPPDDRAEAERVLKIPP